MSPPTPDASPSPSTQPLLAAFPPLPAGARWTALPTLAALDARGPDARDFLHGQLSSDVRGLAVDAGQYATYNSPKGRMLATLVVWRRAPDHFTLVLAADLAAAMRKRLAMYVLRAKVTIEASPRPLFGVVGAAARETLAGAAATFAGVRVDGGDALALPDGRVLVEAAGPDAPAALAGLPAGDEALWRWAGIRAGVAQVGAATSDAIIAQAANVELVGGVDFHKGCYPGQEIIARMQYLGRLKERLRGFHMDGPVPVPGTPLYAADREEAAGSVVDAAPSPVGGVDLLAVTREDAVDAPLSVDGRPLAARALPYAIPALANERVRV
jgi:folate-binding protein YgfZ